MFFAPVETLTTQPGEMANALNIGVAISLVWVVKVVLQKWMSLNAARKSLANCPGGSILILHPFRTLSLVTGPFFPPKGFMGYYFARFSLYKAYGSSIVSSIIFSRLLPIYWLSDGDAIKAVSYDRIAFPKDTEPYATLNIYGENLVGTEGSEWKRHRSIANSAFNEANNALVWRETVRVIHEWFEDIDSAEGKTRHLLDDLTLVALLVISSAGFGRHASYNEDFKTEPPPGHKMAFKHAVTSAIGHLIPKAIMPGWAYDLSRRVYLPFLTPLLGKAEDSFEATRQHMLEVVSLARSWVAGGKSGSMDAALLRNLVEANMVNEDDAAKHLSDDELLSNTFTFLLAGHETTAHTLCFAFVLLALYPDVQEKVFEESCRLWPTGVQSPESSTSYKESIPRLEYTWAVFHETLRLFPPVARLAKDVAKDTTLKARHFSTGPKGELRNVKEYSVDVKKGDMVLIDIIALHMNPIHWGDDVAEFRPERFVDTESYKWPREGFNAFASGPRSCIGQRFAITEALCALSHVTRRYEILIPDEFKGKTREELKDIMLQWSPGITITPKNALVRFRRRT